MRTEEIISILQKKKKNGAGRHGCDLHTVDLGFKSMPMAANVTH